MPRPVSAGRSRRTPHAQLLRRFLRAIGPGPEQAEPLHRIRVAQCRRLVAAARDVEADPTDPDAATIFLPCAYAPCVGEDRGGGLVPRRAGQSGMRSTEIGRFEDALPWNEYTARK